jgi:gluconolactonase
MANGGAGLSSKQEAEMKRAVLLSLVLVLTFAVQAVAGGPAVINPKSAFPEGPVWVDGKLYYAEYGAQAVKTWDGKANQVLWEMKGTGPSAVVPYGKDGFLVTCYDNGTLAHISKDGKTLKIYKADGAGNPLVGPNDFAADKKGGVYFTTSGPWESEPIAGKIYYIDAKGSIKMVADDLHYANGLALSADGKTLYCAESEAGRIISFKVADDASLSGRRLFVRVGQVDPGSGATPYPDGIKLDSKGNLWIGQFSMGRIVVVGPDKKLVKTYEVPSTAAPNMNFGPGEKTLYIMAVDDVNNAPYWGKVYMIKLD